MGWALLLGVLLLAKAVYDVRVITARRDSHR